jgi:ABC-type multidrug transport system fused ATPase/permease subunit
MTLRYLVQILGSVVVLFVLSWSLTLVMLAVVPVVAVGAVIYGRFVQARARQRALSSIFMLVLLLFCCCLLSATPLLCGRVGASFA